jgi:hypothetical protein
MVLIAVVSTAASCSSSEHRAASSRHEGQPSTATTAARVAAGASSDFKRFIDPDFTAVSCPSVTQCIAVGGSTDEYQDVTFPVIERWNGSVWTKMSSPRPSGTNIRFLGVACPTQRFCAAVGPVAEVWKGSSWHLTPTPVQAVLSAVSCTSPTRCFAVGSTGQQPVIERWDGRRWSLDRRRPSGRMQLSGVSCTASGQCVAVGSRLWTSHGVTFGEADSLALARRGWGLARVPPLVSPQFAV